MQLKINILKAWSNPPNIRGQLENWNAFLVLFQMESGVRKYNNELLLPFRKVLRFCSYCFNLSAQSWNIALPCNPVREQGNRAEVLNAVSLVPWCEGDLRKPGGILSAAHVPSKGMCAHTSLQFFYIYMEAQNRVAVPNQIHFFNKCFQSSCSRRGSTHWIKKKILAHVMLAFLGRSIL